MDRTCGKRIRISVCAISECAVRDGNATKQRTSKNHASKQHIVKIAHRQNSMRQNSTRENNTASIEQSGKRAHAKTSQRQNGTAIKHNRRQRACFVQHFQLALMACQESVHIYNVCNYISPSHRCFGAIIYNWVIILTSR